MMHAMKSTMLRKVMISTILLGIVVSSPGNEQSTLGIDNVVVTINEGVPGVTNGPNAAEKVINRQGHYFSDAQIVPAVSMESATALPIKQLSQDASPIDCIVMLNALYKTERFSELRGLLGITDMDTKGVYSDGSLTKATSSAKKVVGFKPLLAIETTDQSGIMFFYDSISQDGHMIQYDYLKKVGSFYAPSLPPQLRDRECFDIFNALVHETLSGKKALSIK